MGYFLPNVWIVTLSIQYNQRWKVDQSQSMGKKSSALKNEEQKADN